LPIADQACSDLRCAVRLKQHMQAILLGTEEATVTNFISLNGRAQQDWTADYRLYSQDRVDENVLFGAALDELQKALPPERPLVLAMDDTLIRKTGTYIDGVKWRRDPLGPPFQTNLVRGQRFLQLSAAWPLQHGQARMVPVLFQHAPTADKAPRDADDQQRAEYREAQRQKGLNAYAIKAMQALRTQCAPQRHIICCGDGSFTNGTVIKNRPKNSTYIGRARKDACFHHLPPAQPGKTGRPRRYGQRAPTPEQLRQDKDVPWQQIEAFASGERHLFNVKTRAQLLWRKTGTQQTLRMVVIAPTPYRLRKGSKLLYRQPAYLICTDEDLPLEDILQYYLWRWGIEVNFREEKTLLGTGDAQVRTPASNQHLPAVMVATYALLWVAALRMVARDALPAIVRPPCWRKKQKPSGGLPSTGDLLRILRQERWAASLCVETLGHFVNDPWPHTKSHKLVAEPRADIRPAI
jgi:hypothetical protein